MSQSIPRGRSRHEISYQFTNPVGDSTRVIQSWVTADQPSTPPVPCSILHCGPPQPRRDKGLAVAAADPFAVSATILQPLQRVSGYANRRLHLAGLERTV